MKMIFASNNKNKIQELRAHGLEFVGLKDAGLNVDPPETGDTFEANALQKASYVEILRPDAWILAEDSGVCVDALGGAPGVYSKRFSPEQTDYANNLLLLHKLYGEANRQIEMVSCFVLLRPGLAPLWSRHAVSGTVSENMRGTSGFGYDPIFVPDGEKLTLAELPPDKRSVMYPRLHALEGILRMLDRHL